MSGERNTLEDQDIGSTAKQRQRTYAVAAAISPTAGLLLGPIGLVAGPLAVLYLRRSSDSFSAAHARNALNVQMTFVITLLTCAALGTYALATGSILLAAPALALLGGTVAWWAASTIIQTSRAWRGEYHHTRGALHILNPHPDTK